jgi:Cu-Zn family superoxide dismutase
MKYLNHRILTWAAAAALTCVGCKGSGDADRTPVGAEPEGARVGTKTGALAPGQPEENAAANTANHHADHDDKEKKVAVLEGTGDPVATGAATQGAAPHTGPWLEAEAEFKSAPQMNVKGEADLDEVEGGVRIVVEVENAPVGVKGIHIHETDNCSDIPNKSMGEHFAPTVKSHGLPNTPHRHLGDLGNITIEQNGKGRLDITIPGANLKPNDPLSFIGKSIVIHEADDKGTGASGDAGKPIACAPIRPD